MSTKIQYIRQLAAKVTFYLVLLFIGLILSTYLLLRLSPIQTYVTQKVSSFLSDELKTKISIGSVDISWFLNVELNRIYVEDLEKKPILKAEKIIVDIGSITFRDKLLSISKIITKDLNVNLRYYPGSKDLNLQFILDYFADTTTSPSSPWNVRLANVKMENTRFVYDIADEPFVDYGIDYNHLDIRNLNVEIEHFKFVGDTMFAKINHISAKERSGFTINDFCSMVKVSSAGIEFNQLLIKTPGSNIKMDLNFEYGSWNQWNDFIDSVGINAIIRPSKLALDEISSFASALKGMNDTLTIQANFKGKISAFRIRDFRLSYKENTKFVGSIRMDGLPNIDKTFIMVKADKLSSNLKEIESFYLPDKQHIQLPDFLDQIGDVKAFGRFTGYYYDFVSNATFITGYGQLQTDISIQPSSTTNSLLTYNGKVSGENFALGKLLNQQERLGNVSFIADIKGSGLNQFTEAKFNLNISKVLLDNYQFENIKTSGTIHDQAIAAELNSSYGDFNLNLFGNYNYKPNLPDYHLHAKVNNISVAKMLRIDQDTLGSLSSIIDIDLTGNTIDNFNGKVDFDSLNYFYKGKNYVIDNLNIFTKSDSLERIIDLKWKYFDFSLKGRYSFNDFGTDYKLLINSVLPSLFPEFQASNKVDEQFKIKMSSNYFNLNLNLHNTSELSEIINPNYTLADKSTLRAHYSKNTDSLAFSFISPKLFLNGINIDNLNLSGEKSKELLQVNLYTHKLMLSDSFKLSDFKIITSVSGDNLIYKIKWGSIFDSSNYGAFDGNIDFLGKNEIHSTINNGYFLVLDSLWNISPNNEFIYQPKNLSFSNFEISSNTNKLKVNGKLTENSSDFLSFDFYNFNIEYLNPFIVKYFPTVNGILNGNFKLSDVWTTTNYISDLTINNFYVDNQALGNVLIKSSWEVEKQAASIDVSIISEEMGNKLQNLKLFGYYYPYSDANNFDLNISANKLKTALFQFLLSSFSSKLDGTVTGELKLEGKVAQPILKGKALANIKELKIDFTNTSYSFDDYIHFDNGIIWLKNVKLKDVNYTKDPNNQALCNFTLKHEYFTDFEMDLKVEPKMAEVLNTNYDLNPLYYGKAFGSGILTIKGPFDDLKMKIDMETKKGSSLSVNIEDESEVQKFDFLTFKQPYIELDSNFKITPKPEDEPFALDLDLIINATQDAEIKLVMNRQTNDVISARGAGNLKMKINEEGDISIFGKYNIARGEYIFKFGNIFSKSFSLKEGSSVSWDGNLEDAKIDITAYYKTYAKLYDLLQQVDTSDIYKRPSKVLCLITIKGDLYNPEITLSIDLPDETTATKDLVNQILYLNDDKVNNNLMNLNFISLLMLGRFQPPSGFDVGESPSLISSNAAEMLVNQLGGLLNKLSKSVDIGLDWNPGDEVTNQEIAVALSYRMLDDRLTIDGKFGSGGETRGSESNRIIGDVEIQWKLIKDGNMHLKAYNRTNYDDPLKRKAPYTQGVGIVFRRDFDNFSELFRRQSKAKKGLN